MYSILKVCFFHRIFVQTQSKFVNDQGSESPVNLLCKLTTLKAVPNVLRRSASWTPDRTASWFGRCSAALR